MALDTFVVAGGKAKDSQLAVDLDILWQCAIKNVANHQEGAQNIWALASPAPNPSLLSTWPWPARPPIPHFYRQASLASQPLTFIDRPTRPPNPSLQLANSSLLLAKPSLLLDSPSLLLDNLSLPLAINHTPHFIGQTPHFYQPSQSAPCRNVSDRVGPCRHRAMPGWAVSPCRPDTGTSL